MRAIQRLRLAGLTRADIADKAGVTRHAVGFWERGERSPNHSNREALIELALSRGITLLAADFSTNHNAKDESE